MRPTLFAYVTATTATPAALLERGVAAVTARETRWARRDIKSTALLANVLLKKLAADAGAFETIMIEDGELTEGSSTAVHALKDGVIYSPPEGRRILSGTTRAVVTELADRLHMSHQSCRIPETLLRSADEIWLSFATRGVLPVTSLDGAPVGSGKPGAAFERMHAAFVGYLQELSATPPL